MTRTAQWWITVLLVLVACLCPAAARAETGGAGVAVDVCVRRATPEAQAAALLRRPAGFTCGTAQTAWGPGDYWVMSRPLGGIPPHEARVLRSYAVWQARSVVWAHYADGAVVRLSPAPHLVTVGTGIVHLLPGRAAAPDRLLWRVEGAGNTRGLVAGAHLFTLAEYGQRNTGAGLMVGWFAGLCVAFLFFNFVLWLALRHQFQIAYCAMVGGLLMYVVTDAGLVRRAFRDLGTTANLKMSGLTFTLCIVGGLWFARSFLEAEVVGPRLKRANRLTVAALLSAAATQATLPPAAMALIDKPQAVAFFLALAMLVLLAWRAWRCRSAFRWIWSATIVVPALLAAMRVSNSFPALGKPFAMGDSMVGVMAAGMFASALAIAYRIRLLARERDRALEQESAARMLADIDPLTGLLNRRAFLRQAIGRAGEQSLLVIDLDHFKHVNDTIGHDGGDEVLRVVARALRAAVPDTALVSRIGGEEFAIVTHAAEPVPPSRILDGLRGQRMPFDITVTASVGVCTGPLLRETDWKAMYGRADQALFAAKAAGRDRARDAGRIAMAA